MKDKFIGDDDLVFNTASRLPVCFCIDTSASMNKATDLSKVVYTGEKEFIDGKYWDVVEETDTIMTEMIKGINKFYDAIRKNEQAKLSCEVAVVSFDEEARVLSNFANIEKKLKFNMPDDGDTTNMSKGLNLALDLLEKRKQEYNENGVDYYQPWLVIFTDGEPSDSIVDVQRRIRKLEDDKKLTVFTFALDKSVNMNLLASLSKRKPLSIKNGKYGDFFEWLGKSVSMVSNSRVGDTVKLDVSMLTDWAEI